MPIVVPALPVADYSSAQIAAAALAGYPVAGVMRYAAAGRSDVNITAAEYENLDALNIPVGITCEQSATFLLGGRSTGRSIAQGSLDVTRSGGIPDGVTAYAADFQIDSTQMPTLLDTLTGCADITGWDDVGVYGDYDAIEWLIHNSPVTSFWQTSSWSGGRVHPAAALVQDRYWTQSDPITIGGGAVDLSTVRGDWRPRNGADDVLNDADKAWISQEISNGVKAELTFLMGARTQPPSVDPKTVTTLSTLADAIYLMYRGDATHPGLVPAVSQLNSAVEQVQAHIANGQPGSVDPAFVAAVENLAGALQGGLSWTVTTQTPKAAQ